MKVHISTNYKMRVRIINLRLALNALYLSVFVFMSACSVSDAPKSSSKSVDKKTVPTTVKVTGKELKHSHPSNPCTAALDHSHVFEDIEHQHSYDCENTNKIISNAHVHEATKKTRRFRHVHPNGANKHSHHKE